MCERRLFFFPVCKILQLSGSSRFGRALSLLGTSVPASRPGLLLRVQPGSPGPTVDADHTVYLYLQRTLLWLLTRRNSPVHSFNLKDIVIDVP